MATRERKVWPREQVAHLWANKSQDEARDPSGNFYFTGRALFSYGSHYVFAAHVDTADGAAILWNDASSTVTTNKHRSNVYRATHNGAPRLGVDGLQGSDITGRDWMLSLAQRVARDAGERYENAAACVRASAKRNGLIISAGRYVSTARTLARTVAAGVGDAATATATDKRAARTLLKLLDSLPPVVRIADDADAAQRKAQNVAQRESAAANAFMLNRDAIRQKLVTDAAHAARTAQWAREAIYNDDIGESDYLGAYMQARDAQELADSVRERAKAYKLRAPKLPDMHAFLDDIAPRVAAAKRTRLESVARGALKRAERGYRILRDMRRRRETNGYANEYGVKRDAENVDNAGQNADSAGVSDAVPAWVRERAAAIVRKLTRADDIETTAGYLLRIASHERSGDSYRDAGHARDAVREYRNARDLLIKAIRDLPESHPAWVRILGAPEIVRATAQSLDRMIATLSAQFAAEDAAKLAAWRAGESSTFPRFHGNDSPCLRVSRDGKAIESSWGAIVPVAVAPILWRLVQRARKSGEPIDFLPDDSRPRVGSFRLDGVASDGGIKVGCHDIAWCELHHIAERLGYITQGATV